VPGKPQEAPVLLVGGDVYTVSGDVIPGGQVLFDKGKIVAVGKDLKAPADAKRVDVSGKRVYPGLLSAGSDLGLAEISSVRGSIDRGEAGQVNPNARAEVAVNPDSEWIPVARANGVLLNLTVPNGGVLTGSSALLQLDGWTWEDMTVKAPVAVHLSWPRMAPVRGWEEEETPEAQVRGRDDQLKAIDKAFTDARAYLAGKKAATQPADHKTDFDARWEAMIPLLEGKMPLVVDADEIRQIQAAVAFAAKEKLKLILLGGYDAPLCADLLKKHDVPVIVGGVHRLPMRRDASPDEPFTVPERLRQAGIKFCIAHSGRFGGSNVRNLPYHAGTAAAYGLPQDEALKSITLYPAQILGVDDRVGSLAEGKDATLFVANGDILETPTKVEMAFVQGRQIDLSSRHTKLWEKYRERYAPGRFTDHATRVP
jgi:imidazolonepropionase-like amidohydrolase